MDEQKRRLSKGDFAAEEPAHSAIRRPHFIGRGSHIRPANRFEKLALQDLDEHADEQDLASSKVGTDYLVDDSRSILSENDSPDIPFRYSLNPYRGCAHGCAYCYARPTHEYLGFDAGLDFETKIMVKEKAPELLEQRLRKENWQAEPIMMSGVTDCYQPIERKLELTRECLKVAQKFNQPIGIVTKNALVSRDIDILQPMSKYRLTRVAISLTTLDQSLTRQLEPRSSSPNSRLNAISQLSEAGVEVTVMIAPVIPGLNEQEIPALLEAARDHGAKYAGYVLLRLPLTVEPVFIEWLERCVPHLTDKVKSRVAATRDGNMNQSQFGTRMRGSGVLANHFSNTFKVFAKKYGLNRETPTLNSSLFALPDGQMRLF